MHGSHHKYLKSKALGNPASLKKMQVKIAVSMAF
jgi:hypothetical protein